MANVKEQILNALNDAEFAKSVLSMSPEEVQAAFKEKGIEISVEEIIAAGEQLNQIMSSHDELSEGNLDMVSGGAKGDGAAGVIVGFFITVGAFIAGLAGISW